MVDEFKRIKDKYFEQSKEQTGELSGVVFVLNDFVQKYDRARNTFLAEKEKIAQDYVQTSAHYVQENKRIRDTFTEEVQNIREDARQKISDQIQKVRDKITEIIGSPVPEGAMPDVTMIRSFSGSLSDYEVKVFLNKYKGCYLVTKTIFSALSEGQAERLGMKFISADMIGEGLDKIKETSDDFIRNYNGVLTYELAFILNGDDVKVINEAFESFISIFGE